MLPILIKYKNTLEYKNFKKNLNFLSARELDNEAQLQCYQNIYGWKKFIIERILHLNSKNFFVLSGNPRYIFTPQLMVLANLAADIFTTNPRSKVN